MPEEDPTLLRQICLPAANIVTCPARFLEVKFIMLIEFGIAITICYFFVTVVFPHNTFELRKFRPNKVTQFWTLLAFSMILCVSYPVIPNMVYKGPKDQKTTDRVKVGRIDSISLMQQVTSQYAYMVLGDQAIGILRSLRLPCVRFFRGATVFLYVVLSIMIVVQIGFLIGDMRMYQSNVNVFYVVMIPMYMDFVVKGYAVILLSMAFVLNDSVAKYMPQRYLVMMKVMIFSAGFITYLKAIRNVHMLMFEFNAISMLDMWLALDVKNRIRLRIFIREFLAVTVDMMGLLVLAVMMICCQMTSIVESQKTNKLVTEQSLVP